jgi:predicted nucleic acid-binding protein
MEVLAGARDQRHLRTLEQMLYSHGHVPVEQDDYVSAATIWRTCRRGGDTPRSLLDCLIAAVAMRNDAAVLHNDRDFDVIARHVGLVIDT